MMRLLAALAALSASPTAAFVVRGAPPSHMRRAPALAMRWPWQPPPTDLESLQKKGERLIAESERMEQKQAS